jgi:hypothetical protein
MLDRRFLPENRRTVASALVAGLVALVTLGAWLGWALERRHPGYRDQPFLRELVAAHRRGMFPMRTTALPGGKYAYELELITGRESGMERAVGLQLQLITLASPDVPELPFESATVEEIEGPLRFAAPPPVTWPQFKTRHRVFLRFLRVDQSPDSGPARERRFRVRLTSEKKYGLALFAFYHPTPANRTLSATEARGWLETLAPHSPSGAVFEPVVPIPIGQLLFPLAGEPQTRSELLGQVWDFPGGAQTVRWLAAAAVLLWGIGFAVLATAAAPTRAGPAALRVGVGSTLAFAGVVMAQALCCFPLLGHDEQDHLWSFLQANGNPQPSPELKRYTREIHWDRIILGPGNTFSPDDALTPYPAMRQEWASAALTMVDRSGFAHRAWRLLGDWVVPGHLSRTQFRVRLGQGTLCSLAFGLSMALLSLGVADRTAKPFASFGLLLVPVFPYLALSISNYGFITAAVLLLAGVLAVGRLSAAWEWLVGLGLGVGLGICLQASRSTLPALGLLGFLLTRALPPPNGQRSFRQIASFWLCLGLGWVTLSGITTPEYIARIHALLVAVLPRGLAAFIVRVPLAPVVGAGCAIGMGLELLGQALRNRWTSGRSPTGPEDGSAPAAGLPSAPATTGPRTGWGRIVAWAPGLLWLGWVGWFTLFVGPESQTTGRELPLGQFLGINWMSFAASLGAGRHDYVVSQTFWNTLCMLEITLPDRVFDLFVLYFSLGLAAGLIRLARSGDGRRWVYWGVIAVSWLAYFSLMLQGSRQSQEPLIGRYQVGVYAVFLAVTSRGWLPLLASLAHRQRFLGAALLGLVPAVAQGLVLKLMLDRFF